MIFKSKKNRFFQLGLIFLMLLIPFVSSIAQTSQPTTGVYEKPYTKISMYDLFYTSIDDTDVNTQNAQIEHGFLKVNRDFVRVKNGTLSLRGNALFTTPFQSLPFLNTVEFQQNGQINLPEVTVYIDNYDNITTEAEAWANVNNPNNTIIQNECINFVFTDPVNLIGSCPNGNTNFTSDHIDIINAACGEMASILCCDDSSPITIEIVPVIADQADLIGSASPQIQVDDFPNEGNCNNITNNTFLSGIQGVQQPSIASIQLNICLDWYTGIDPNDPSNLIGNNQIDLYSVVLHEMMHAIGLASRITGDGSPLGGVYSPWDLFLEISDGNGGTIPLLEQVDADNPLCCYSYEPISELGGQAFNWPDDAVTASLNNQISIAGVPVGVCSGAQNTGTDGYYLNLFSHLSEDCSMASNPCEPSDYVINWQLCPGEVRRNLHADELQILETLGYGDCPDSEAQSCYTSLNDDGVLYVTENMTEEYNLNILLVNDILASGFDLNDINPVDDCGNAPNGLATINIQNNTVDMDATGVAPGLYTFCYQIETCDGFCDVAEVTVFVRPAILSEDCEPEYCNLMCFGGFEELMPVAGFGYHQQLGYTDYEFLGTGGNSADIQNEGENNFIHLFNGHAFLPYL